jgi:hypothetical protein
MAATGSMDWSAVGASLAVGVDDQPGGDETQLEWTGAPVPGRLRNSRTVLRL